ncbi:MAG: hypothetical protein ACKVS8_00010 [Phycisphaerales bacterium]
MEQPAHPHAHRRPQRIEIKLRDVAQLFNTMDPSPFHERELDPDAEEFILGRAQEWPPRDPVVLVVHLGPGRAGGEPTPRVGHAVRRHFLTRAQLSKLEFRRLMRDARTSLAIGVAFLCVCLALSELFTTAAPHTLKRILSEGLMIAGWVAMWKPLQMYLYEWWPVRRRVRMFRKLSRMAVQVLER